MPPGSAASRGLPGMVPVAWPTAARGWMSTRDGGVSGPPWDSLNLGGGVGDAPDAVAENRRRFEAALAVRPVWLRQVHGAGVLRLRAVEAVAPVRDADAPVWNVDASLDNADAAWTDEPGVACAVLVADCLPVLLATRDGRAVAAAHAGWRGLAAGVLENTVRALRDGSGSGSDDIVAWLGPSIGPRRFEVGSDVHTAFADQADCFTGSRPHADGSPRWLADLPALARGRLAKCGVSAVSGGAWCTVEDPSRFFSFRRDGRTGRMAAAVAVAVR